MQAKLNFMQINLLTLLCLIVGEGVGGGEGLNKGWGGRGFEQGVGWGVDVPEKYLKMGGEGVIIKLP